MPSVSFRMPQEVSEDVARQDSRGNYVFCIQLFQSATSALLFKKCILYVHIMQLNINLGYPAFQRDFSTFATAF